MPIYREIEGCFYEDVKITIEEIVEEIDEKETIKLINLLIKKFPKVISFFANEVKGEYAKLFPEPLKSELIKKFQSEYKTLNEFTKS